MNSEAGATISDNCKGKKIVILSETKDPCICETQIAKHAGIYDA
jgi:hypothetical protein